MVKVYTFKGNNITEKLINYCTFKVVFEFDDFPFYKEDFHQQLINTEMKYHFPQNFPAFCLSSYNMTRNNNVLSFDYHEMAYGNLAITEKLEVNDDKVVFAYTESSDQTIILPMINRFEAHLIMLTETFKDLSKGFLLSKLNIEFETKSNVDVHYYETYNLFHVTKEWNLTYRSPSNSVIKCKLDISKDSSEAIRRFMQLFVTDVKSQYPYLQLDMNDYKAKFKQYFVEN